MLLLFYFKMKDLKCEFIIKLAMCVIKRGKYYEDEFHFTFLNFICFDGIKCEITDKLS